MKVTNTYRKLLAIAIVIFIIAGTIAGIVKTNGGDVLIREVRINPRGVTLSGMLYLPKDALEVDEGGQYVQQRPAVLLSHGLFNSNQMQDPFAMELSRRGFIVLSMDMTEHGNSETSTALEEPWDVVYGAMDFYDYILTLPYVDKTRIGFSGHSMGGMNTGDALGILTGFFTLEDKLLNLLHDELGVEVTAEDVAAQNPDSLAKKLDEYNLAVYEMRKAEITASHSVRPMAQLFVGSGPGFAFMMDSSVAQVAGHPVWRDVQATVGVAIGNYEENPWTMFGTDVDGIIDSSRIEESSAAKRLYGIVDKGIDERVWYSLNLSGNENQLQNTEIVSFDAGDYQNAQLREAIDKGAARVFYQPNEDHLMNHFSVPTVAYCVEFFTTVMNYNNGELSEGAVPIDSSNSIWLVKEIANGIMLVCMLLMVYAVAMLLLDKPFFASLKGEAAPPALSVKDVGFWICAALFIAVPSMIYIKCYRLGEPPTEWNNYAGLFPTSWVLSQNASTGVAVWAVVCGVFSFVVLNVKYFLTKKRNDIGYKEAMVLPGKGFVKALILALAVTSFAFLVVTLSNFFFEYNDTRFWVLAFRQPNKQHLLCWMCYVPIFFIFYFVNSIVVNSSRMKDISESKNLAIVATINSLSVGALMIFAFGFLFITGHTYWNTIGQDQFLPIGVVFPMIVELPIAAVFSRKFYLKTGSIWLGALLNTLIFTWFLVGNTCTYFSMFLG